MANPAPPPADPLAEFKLGLMADENGYERDLWPSAPTREECVLVSFPTDFASINLLHSVWPALSPAEKERLGFKRAIRVSQIERLVLAADTHRTALRSQV